MVRVAELLVGAQQAPALTGPRLPPRLPALQLPCGAVSPSFSAAAAHAAAVVVGRAACAAPGPAAAAVGMLLPPEVAAAALGPLLRPLPKLAAAAAWGAAALTTGATAMEEVGNRIQQRVGHRAAGISNSMPHCCTTF